ncbi:MAG: S8 family serine peptidase [Brumimicrobium sp.]|nr:S8 family serine peptidase [Brumimicrobium sp.]
MPDSVYLYNKEHQKDWYYVQKDVFSFNFTDNSIYNYDLPGYIDSTSTYSNSFSIFNFVYFSNTSTKEQREEFINSLKSLENFKSYAWSISKTKDAHYSENKYYPTDDLILVTFKDPNLSSIKVNNLANKYNLKLVYEPIEGLPEEVSWSYIFQLKESTEIDSMATINISAKINENEIDLVKLAEPNAFSVEPLICQPTTEMALTPGNIRGTWHIRNTGDVIWNGPSGKNDADADLCECWGAGYTGKGIKMGIIDFGGIEFSHNDFEGSNIPKAFNAMSEQYETSDFQLQYNGHAMQVTGIVAATPNNTTLGQRWAVGAAYNTEVIPYINEFTDIPTMNTQIVKSIQAAVFEGVDIINMSFKTNAAFGSIDIQINNAIATGRPDPNNPNIALGIVCVAAVGNDDVEGSHFPANMPNVIGVGWSNPNDYRCSSNAPGGGWSVTSGQGSTYGPPEYNYDVVAPGELLMTTILSLLGQGSHTVTLGSSFSSPIVASIAAMILEKNPSLTWSDVRDLIRDGAEKVNSDTYDYNMFGNAPGYNNEMFYGRVSCINSINQTSNIAEEEKSIELTVMNMGEYQYLVFIPESGKIQPYELYDMSGRLLLNGNAAPGNFEIPIDLSSYHRGIYILKIYNSERTILSTKLMK